VKSDRNSGEACMPTRSSKPYHLLIVAPGVPYWFMVW
jgi:hypothetical protein